MISYDSNGSLASWILNLGVTRTDRQVQEFFSYTLTPSPRQDRTRERTRGNTTPPPPHKSWDSSRDRASDRNRGTPSPLWTDIQTENKTSLCIAYAGDKDVESWNRFGVVFDKCKWIVISQYDIPAYLQMVHQLVSLGANSIWEHSLLEPSHNKPGKRKPNPRDPVQ